MDSEFTSAIASASAELAVLAAKGTVTAISNKQKQIRKNKNLETMANEFEAVIAEIIQERNEAIAIAQSYQAEINRYQISDEDILHLQATIQTALEVISSMSPELNLTDLEKLKNLISADTLKSMQLLGFDYKAAIGQPLTEVCAQAIKAKLGGGPAGKAKNKSR